MVIWDCSWDTNSSAYVFYRHRQPRWLLLAQLLHFHCATRIPGHFAIVLSYIDAWNTHALCHGLHTGPGSALACQNAGDSPFV